MFMSAPRRPLPPQPGILARDPRPGQIGLCHEEVILDIDKHGRLLGIEILGVDRKPQVSRVTFGRSANAVYMELARERDARFAASRMAECPTLKGDVILEVDGDGRLIGLEMLRATRILPYRFMEEAERP
jgi:uncharacterized protein YuzE